MNIEDFSLESGEQVLWRGEPGRPAGFNQFFIEMFKLLLGLGLLPFLVITAATRDLNILFYVIGGNFLLSLFLAGIDAATDLGVRYVITNKRLILTGNRKKEIRFAELTLVRYAAIGDSGFFLFSTGVVCISLMGIDKPAQILMILPDNIREAMIASSKSPLPALVSLRPLSAAIEAKKMGL